MQDGQKLVTKAHHEQKTSGELRTGKYFEFNYLTLI